MQPVLVVLAAGLGRRFGGDKQVAGIGPGGHPLVAYALHDAHQAGFGRAVLVVREGLESVLRERLGDTPLPVSYVLQPGGRERPWGTGHAVLAAAGQVDQPFMVINADDFYGPGTYSAMARFLASGPSGALPPTYALATFPLQDTLSEEGPVNRGVCRAGPEGFLAEIREVPGILPGSADWEPRTPVSLNAWGFTPEVFPQLSAGFASFRTVAGPDDEFMLPAAINQLVASGEARVRLVAAPGPWIGVTWPADLPRAADQLARLVAAGQYPALGGPAGVRPSPKRSVFLR